ncbi:MAG: RecQ family ATP-dependent DNA helicase [Thermodesulfobacteriota bacterium]
MKKVFGFREFRPGQEAILEAIFSGEDILVVMPTGGGKSLCYQLPALILPGMTLVISPLIALMKDQVDSLSVFEVPAISVNSLMGIGEQEEALGKIAEGSYRLVYASPERLRSPAFLKALKKNPISLVAVDEAHCISVWGHDFRPDYLKIGQALDWLGRPQTIALTATATDRVREDIVSQLKLRAPKWFITGFDRKNLFFEVVLVKGSKEKLSHLSSRLERLRGGAIVYAGTRKGVESIVRGLGREGIEALGYHAGLEDEERNRIQEAFLEGRADIVAATNAFGMGIDRSDIRLIMHYNFPGSIEAYYQECGRAGRDGSPSTCLLLFSPSDRRLQEFFIEMNYPDREVILSVYQALLQRSEDPIWLTHREIGHLCNPPTEEMAVSSSLKILEEAEVVHRLHRYENLAELYLKRPPKEIRSGIPKRSTSKAAFIEFLTDHYTEDELLEGIQFLPDEVIEKAHLSKETFRRVMADMEEHGEGTYIPPFRGRGVRLLSRMAPSELPINFETLQLRKAHQLEKLNRMIDYGASSRCRRAFLLQYFGEFYPSQNCGGCDHCQNLKVRPATEENICDPLLAVKILSGVARIKGRFGLGLTVKMLTGSQEKSMEKFKLDQLSTYGLLAEFTQRQVEKWIQELLEQGYLKQEFVMMGEKHYKVLLLTPQGWEVMKQRGNIPLSPPLRKETEEKGMEGESDKGLFEDLRKLRLELARAEGLPAYCIFQDRTLREMASRVPDTREKMMSIVGVGEITFKKYGALFLEAILTYRRKHSIGTT